MDRSGASRARQAQAWILGVLLLSLLLFACVYPALEARHCCTGKDCAVCELVELCGSYLLREMGAGTPQQLCWLLSLAFLSFRTAPQGVEILRFTPVAGKVRMND